MKHAEAIAERLAYLGGTSTTKPEPIFVGDTLTEIIESDVADEEDGRGGPPRHLDQPTRRQVNRPLGGNGSCRCPTLDRHARRRVDAAAFAQA
jgi:hypothetical protein